MINFISFPTGVIIKSISLVAMFLAILLYRPPPPQLVEERDINTDDSDCEKRTQEVNGYPPLTENTSFDELNESFKSREKEGFDNETFYDESISIHL